VRILLAARAIAFSLYASAAGNSARSTWLRICTERANEVTVASCALTRRGAGSPRAHELGSIARKGRSCEVS